MAEPPRRHQVPGMDRMQTTVRPSPGGGQQKTAPRIYAAGAETGAFPQADRLAGGGRSVRFGVPLQFAEERGGVDAELFGGVELVPAVALQDGEDVFAFDVVERAHFRRGADE